MLTLVIAHPILTLIAVLWIGWGYFAVGLLKKIFEKDLKPILEFDVNLFASNSSSSRYDAVNLKKWEVYIGFIILLPIRLILIGAIWLFGHRISYLLCYVFGGKLRTNYSQQVYIL